MASPSRRGDQSVSRHSLQALIVAAVVIAGLYLGSRLLVPLAVSFLLSFLLSNPLIWLERRRVPRAVAVSLVMMTAISIVAGLLWLGADEFSGIIRDWPNYQANIARKLDTIRGAPGAGVQNLEKTFAQLEQEFAAQPPPIQATEKPLPVKVVNGGTLMSSLGIAGATVAGLLGELFAIFVLTLFILLNREHLRNRVLRLFGEGHIVVVTSTFDEAASRVSRYLLSQFSVNACFGFALSVGLAILGVPYAPLWGVLVLFLRFVPYLGTIIAGVCPFLLSLAAFDGWHKPIETLALYLAIELIISSVVEPWLYASRTGISSVAYLISAAFWTMLWGPIGLLLSTPLTVCLMVLGRHLPGLRFLYVLLGDEPVLAEEVQFYQRLLAEDEDEAARMLETALKSDQLARVFDRVVVPALTLAEQDRNEERLSEEKANAIYDVAGEILEIAGERHPCTPEGPLHGGLVCIPARDRADRVVAEALSRMVRQCGSEAEVREDVRSGDEVAVISALPPSAIVRARAVCKRLRSQRPGLRIMLGVWGSDIPVEAIRERLGVDCPDWVVIRLEQALQILAAASVSQREEAVAAG